MAERRSLGKAMEMTPAKMAFIKGQSAGEALPPLAKSEPKPEEKIIEIETSQRNSDSAMIPQTRISRRSSKRRNAETPSADEVLDQLLVPVTIRLPHRMAQALRRAYLEQRLKHAKPDTQQEIVEDALGDWLAIHNYCD